MSFGAMGLRGILEPFVGESAVWVMCMVGRIFSSASAVRALRPIIVQCSLLVILEMSVSRVTKA